MPYPFQRRAGGFNKLGKDSGMEDVSVIGLGTMGKELARVLNENGYRVTVWNRNPDRAKGLVSAGAALAPSAADAIRASPVTVICITSHTDTNALMKADPSALAGRTIIELSTGEASDAEALHGWIEEQGAQCLVGMIATFPKGIGLTESAIVTVGTQSVWEEYQAVLKTLAGKSSYIGPNVKSLAALFAGLFLPRQAFMFGMIYGALVCEKAGISMEHYVAQIPLTIEVVGDYYDLFAETMTSGDFSNPPSSIATYAAAFQDMVDTFRKLDVTSDLPELLHGLLKKGVDSGIGDKQITALSTLMRDKAT
jgi:3-hydroxyisobutyrate dehydrogenase-like beta-hydroxyacid dehydrogenase